MYFGKYKGERHREGFFAQNTLERRLTGRNERGSFLAASLSHLLSYSTGVLRLRPSEGTQLLQLAVIGEDEEGLQGVDLRQVGPQADGRPQRGPRPRQEGAPVGQLRVQGGGVSALL